MAQYQNAMQLATVVSAPFQENTYIAWLAGRSDCLVVDPGLQPRQIFAVLEAEGLTPACLLVTHGHADHIGGNRALKERWPACPIVIGRGDAPMLTDSQHNLSADYGLPLVSPPADLLLDEGAVYRAAGFDLEVLEIPGHSPGHVVYVYRGERVVVFGGDVLFSGSIGRTDLPGGSFELLASGIHEKLFSLPEDSVVLPGHGPATTIGEEKRNNPFVGRAARAGR